MEENTLDFNFWPSFSDLMLTLVLILVIVVFAVIAAFSIGAPEPIPEDEGTVDLWEVEQAQMEMVLAIAKEYGVERKEIEPKKTDSDSKERKSSTFVIPIHLENGGYTEILIQNEPTLQRYSFSDRVLFEPDRYDLNEDGQKTLLIVGKQIQKKLHNIREIQIQGHADPDRPAFQPSNLHLAALRAIEVFRFLQKRIGIDPTRHLMSATSFGEYKPVQRSVRDNAYTPQKLKMHNRTKGLKEQNRRMEILLFYRFEQADSQKDSPYVH